MPNEFELIFADDLSIHCEICGKTATATLDFFTGFSTEANLHSNNIRQFLNSCPPYSQERVFVVSLPISLSPRYSRQTTEKSSASVSHRQRLTLSVCFGRHRRSATPKAAAGGAGRSCSRWRRDGGPTDGRRLRALPICGRTADRRPTGASKPAVARALDRRRRARTSRESAPEKCNLFVAGHPLLQCSFDETCVNLL